MRAGRLISAPVTFRGSACERQAEGCDGVRRRKDDLRHDRDGSVARRPVLYLSTGSRMGDLCAHDLGQDVLGAGGPDEGLGMRVVIGDAQVDGQFKFGTLVKLLRLMRFSEMSRRKHSTMFSQDALVGVKWMTKRGCLPCHSRAVRSWPKAELGVRWLTRSEQPRGS